MIFGGGFWNNYPGTDLHEIDLHYVLMQVLQLRKDMQEVVDSQAITFADPINWNITSQYPANQVVLDSNGDGYISRQPVPAGIPLSNTNYWTQIFSFNDIADRIRDSIALNAGTSATTPQALTAGKLVWWQGDIYRVLVDMPAGTAFIEGTNVERFTVDEKIELYADAIRDLQAADITLQQNIDAEEQARIDADTALQGNIDAEEQARTDADTTLQNNIDAEEQARIDADEQLESEIRNATGTVGNAQGDIRFLFRMYDSLAPQAGCYVGNNAFVLATIDTSDDSAKFYRIDLSTGSITAQNTIAGAGHVNGMCYAPQTDTVYFAVGWLTGGTPQNTVIGFSATTLSITGRYTYDDYVTGMGSYGNDIWIFSNYTNTAKKLNADMSVSGESVEIAQDPDLTGSDAVRQTIGVYKNYIVEVYSTPQVLVFHSMADGTISGYINIADMTNALYWLGEIENVSFYGEEFYINTAAAGYSQGNMALIFKGNMSANAISNPFGLQTINNPTKFYQIYVDAAAPAAGRPLGTQDAPFRYVQEAINSIMSEHVGSVIIHLVSAGNYGSANVSGVGKYVQITGPAGAIIDGLTVSDSYLDIRGVRVNYIDARRATVIINGAELWNNSTQNNAINATFSRIHLQSGSVQTSSTDYPIYANQGTIVTSSSGFTFNGTKKVYVNNGGVYLPGNGDITGCGGTNGILLDKTKIPTA